VTVNPNGSGSFPFAGLTDFRVTNFPPVGGSVTWTCRQP
jgi:hypothetical protein